MAKTVIIGGVAAGASAATRLRRLDEQMEIVLLERGDYIQNSFSQISKKFFPVGFPIFQRRKPFLLSEDPAEIHGVIISDDLRDLADRPVCGLEKNLRISHAHVQHKFHGRDADDSAEAFVEPARAHIS